MDNCASLVVIAKRQTLQRDTNDKEVVEKNFTQVLKGHDMQKKVHLLRSANT